MRNQRRAAPAAATIEILENRQLLSAVIPSTASTATTTTLTLSTTSSTLGQPVVAKVKVAASKGAARIKGTVTFEENGSAIDTLAGTPLTLTVKNGRASYDFSAGNIGLYTGSQSLEAVFTSGNSLADSTSTAQTVTVAAPTYTTTSDGLEEATVVTGHGPGITTGKTAHVLYTGFLESNGEIFDYASAHNTTSHGVTKKFVLAYDVGAGKVIQGFDEGTVGMKVGETRVLVIPPSLGYGSSANGDIPANSTLVFLVKLKKITNK